MTEAHPSHSLFGVRNKLVLTYDNTKATDGVGAQLQRIYGIYSISRFLGVSYSHTPLGRVDYQGLGALEANAGNPAFHDQFNDTFQIESDVASADDFYSIELQNLSMETLQTLDRLLAAYDAHETGGKPILARLVMPYEIADRYPDCYEACKKISPFSSPVRKGRAWRVALHVRRGEQLALDPKRMGKRMLPNLYFINVAQNVARLLEALGITYQIELHTEVASREFVVQPDHHGIFNRIGAGAVISPSMSKLDDFNVLPNLARCINETTIDCLAKLATADILVMSRSSFSYVGAILNRNGIILYYPFWHAAPSSWITVDPNGTFDHMKFRTMTEGR
jgi:hypothetical protein